MSKNDTDKLQTLFQLSINIYKIHERMVEERDPTKFKMYLEQLRMNMELEEQIYQSLDIEEMKTYLAKYRRTPAINTVRDTQKMAELEKPFYRTICSLRDTRLWEEDPEIIGINDIHITEINRMQRAFKNAIHSSIVMKLKFILIYLNLLRRSKKSRNVKEHLDVLYMNRLLEMNLLDYQLRPLHFDQIDDFLALNWDVKTEPEQEETFGKTCINSLLNYMEGIMNSTESIQIDRSEYIYQLTNYYMATPDQKVSYLAQGDKLFNDPRLTKEKEKIMNQFYYDIDAINQGNDRVRKI